jgi:hypothetical protein
MYAFSRQDLFRTEIRDLKTSQDHMQDVGTKLHIHVSAYLSRSARSLDIPHFADHHNYSSQDGTFRVEG